MFLREPLLDWQREGRLLKDARVSDTEGASGAEDYHIAAKVCTPVIWCFDRSGVGICKHAHPCSRGMGHMQERAAGIEVAEMCHF